MPHFRFHLSPLYRFDLYCRSTAPARAFNCPGTQRNAAQSPSRRYFVIVPWSTDTRGPLWTRAVTHLHDSNVRTSSFSVLERTFGPFASSTANIVAICSQCTPVVLTQTSRSHQRRALFVVRLQRTCQCRGAHLKTSTISSITRER